MVCHQMVAAHVTAMKLLERSANPDLQPGEVARFTNAAARMMDVYQSACLTLVKFKTRGTQRVLVHRFGIARRRHTVGIRSRPRQSHRDTVQRTHDQHWSSESRMRRRSSRSSASAAPTTMPKLAGGAQSGQVMYSRPLSLAAFLVTVVLSGLAPVHAQGGGPGTTPEQGAFAFLSVAPPRLVVDKASRKAVPWNSLGRNLIFKKEIVVGGRYSRLEREFSGANRMNANSIGFDLMKRFTSDTGDWATVHLQLRMAYRWNQWRPEPWTEGEDDWELEWHEATLRLTRWFRGRMNFKLGHFDVPFGLEPVVDTHGSLIQLQSMRNVGFKKDWGLSLYGQLPSFDYEASLTAGSGMELTHASGSYLTSARVGTPTGNFSIGFSGLYGKVKEPAGQLGEEMAAERGAAPAPGSSIRTGKTLVAEVVPDQEKVMTRWRAGLDVRYLYGPLTLKSEVASGRDGGRDIRNALVELDFILVPNRMDLITQVHFTQEDAATRLTGSSLIRRTLGVLGLRYRATSAITLSAALERDLHSHGGPEEDSIAVQLYVYW